MVSMQRDAASSVQLLNDFWNLIQVTFNGIEIEEETCTGSGTEALALRAVKGFYARSFN